MFKLVKRQPETVRDREAGLSLVEILVTLSIIAIFGTVVVINVAPLLGDANDTKARADIDTLSQAIEVFRLTAGRYPTTEEGVEVLAVLPDDPSLAARFSNGPLLDRLPNDPWNAPYQYLYPGENGRFDLWSNGPDGRPGGEDDIGNWAEDQA